MTTDLQVNPVPAQHEITNETPDPGAEQPDGGTEGGSEQPDDGGDGNRTGGDESSAG